MIVRTLPDDKRTDINWDAPCREFGWPNMVTQAMARDLYYPEHDGTLSIKCAFNGEEIYEVNGARYAVDSSSYLILNNGQRYASYIEPHREVESFCIFFRPDFAGDILRALVTPDDLLLDDGRSMTQPVHFLEKLYPHDSLLSPWLFRIRSAIIQGTVTKGWMEEQFHIVLERLLHVHRDLIAEIEKLPAVRRTTRIEIYRRLNRAREYMEANLHQSISLPQIAHEAFLSTHHFLRLFKHAYRETPHQYLTRRRIEKAQELLLSTDKTVTEICAAIGFQSLGSFSWLFRSRIGVSPEGYRSLSRGPRSGRPRPLCPPPTKWPIALLS